MCRSLSRSPCIIFDTGMPVARETTSAISSAPTCVRRSCGFFASSSASFLSAFLSCASSCGSLPYCSSRHLLPVALAPRLFHLELDLVDLLLDVLRAGDVAPSRPATPRPGPRTRARAARSPARSARAASSTPRPFPSSPPRARSSTGSGGGRAGPSPRAWSRSPSGCARRLRRSGRSPCRAGSGR